MMNEQRIRFFSWYNIAQHFMMSDTKIPKKIFIVPYRNRPQQKFFFCKYMSYILENEEDYLIWFSHQYDEKNFNRGAMKNIGFLAIKRKYPNHYKDITIIFNDVDTIPYNKIFDYETEKGIVKHYYGFETSLGGIVVIKGEDFENINGYPNYWSWSLEDACLQKRCELNGIEIDRSTFYPIGSPEILQLFDGISRLVSKKNTERFKRDTGHDGIRSIYGLKYNTNKLSMNPKDNEFVVDNPNIFFLNVTNFMTGVRFDAEEYYNYDLRDPIQNIMNPISEPVSQEKYNDTEQWKHIPYNVANETLDIKQQQQQQQNYIMQKHSPHSLKPPSSIRQPQQASLVQPQSLKIRDALVGSASTIVASNKQPQQPQQQEGTQQQNKISPEQQQLIQQLSPQQQHLINQYLRPNTSPQQQQMNPEQYQHMQRYMQAQQLQKQKSLPVKNNRISYGVNISNSRLRR